MLTLLSKAATRRALTHGGVASAWPLLGALACRRTWTLQALPVPHTGARSTTLRTCTNRLALRCPLPQVQAMVSLFVAVCGRQPRFRVDGGSAAENLALQNIQVRTTTGAQGLGAGHATLPYRPICPADQHARQPPLLHVAQPGSIERRARLHLPSPAFVPSWCAVLPGPLHAPCRHGCAW